MFTHNIIAESTAIVTSTGSIVESTVYTPHHNKPTTGSMWDVKTAWTLYLCGFHWAVGVEDFSTELVLKP